jgi:osmoprotectant transport system ATP-binding protein
VTDPETHVDNMIRLDELTKRFPGQLAVDRVSMAIPQGEIVAFVGPSGCGKTTTLKMINRLIEPTSGRIELDGEDVTDIDPDQLRRRIGYVIQQIGLFPHMTIAKNIATVPKALGWDKDRIDARIDELLELVGMDPEAYRDRYPKALSGGQNQRVGVARALAADPAVMLMDEPFGAVDPITRERLQNEFLRLQQEVQKTICFVTHDIDEAIKMGDRIAIFGSDHRIEQFDTPETILSHPANEFVEDFLGSGAALKRLHLRRVRDVELTEWPTAALDEDRDSLRRKLETAAGHGFLLLLDDQRRPVRWVSRRDLERSRGPVVNRGLPASAMLEPHATLHDALDEMITSNVGSALVVDGRGAYQGVVTLDTVMTAIDTMRAELREQVAVGQWHAAPGAPVEEVAT